jgi:hypothetical protein
LVYFLNQNPEIQVGRNFFEDLCFMADRYQLSEVLGFNRADWQRSSFPSVYQQYLKQERYPVRVFSPEALIQVENASMSLFLSFKYSKQDFDEERLEELSELDDKIALCYTAGFPVAELHYRNAQMTQHELIGKNPFV